MIRKYLTTAYISIITINNVFSMHMRVFKNNAIIKDGTKEFSTQEELIKYLQEHTKDYYFYYIGVLFNSLGQGALENKDLKTLERFHINPNDVMILNFDEFCLYANIQEINKIKITYEEKEIGVDFIISPYALLYKQIRALHIFNSQKNIFYILKYDNYVTLLIFKNKKLLYSSFFYTSVRSDNISLNQHDYIKSDIEEILEKKEEEDAANLFKESDAIFEDLENIENLDSLSLDNIEEEEKPEKEDLTNFAIDMDLFECMKLALGDYYSKDLYDSEFIEDIVIFSDQQISKSVVDLIQDELFIKPHIYEISMHEQLLNIMKESL